MTTSTNPPSKITLLELEAIVDKRNFKKTSIHVVKRYLDHFSLDGEQISDIPLHILSELAIRLRSFLDQNSTLKTLDAAFGGSVASQRRALFSQNEIGEITFDVRVERDRLRAIPRDQRGNGTPHELACAAVAEERGVSEETIKRAYKLSK